MGGGHSHGHAFAGPLSAGGRHKRRLALAFGVILAFFLVEAIAGLLTNSLALLSDAGHMLTDVAGLGMSLTAIHLADRHRGAAHRTYGLHRLEILAALANAALLFGIALYVLYEAIRRLASPPEVLGLPMLFVASLGLLVNLFVFQLLRSGAKESLNLEGACLEVLSDTVGSIGVIVAAVVLQTTGWRYVDPLVGVGIGIFILPRAYRLGAQAVRILVEAAPPTIDLMAVHRDLARLPGVVDVHELHVWTLTSDMEVASAHLAVCGSADSHAVLDQARALLRDRYHVGHATLQVEPENHQGCREISW